MRTRVVGMPLMSSAPPHAEAFLDIVRRLGADLHSARRSTATLDSALDRDLGYDSLGRVELLLRLERHFGVRLPEGTLVSAETPRDLLHAVVAADSSGAPHSPVPEADFIVSSGTTAPEHARTVVEAFEWHLRAHPERVH